MKSALLCRVSQLLTLLVLQHIGVLLVDHHAAETAAFARTDTHRILVREAAQHRVLKSLIFTIISRVLLI
jgi:hypothetical protein